MLLNDIANLLRGENLQNKLQLVLHPIALSLTYFYSKLKLELLVLILLVLPHPTVG